MSKKHLVGFAYNSSVSMKGASLLETTHVVKFIRKQRGLLEQATKLYPTKFPTPKKTLREFDMVSTDCLAALDEEGILEAWRPVVDWNHPSDWVTKAATDVSVLKEVFEQSSDVGSALLEEWMRQSVVGSLLLSEALDEQLTQTPPPPDTTREQIPIGTISKAMKSQVDAINKIGAWLKANEDANNGEFKKTETYKKIKEEHTELEEEIKAMYNGLDKSTNPGALKRMANWAWGGLQRGMARFGRAGNLSDDHKAQVNVLEERRGLLASLLSELAINGNLPGSPGGFPFTSTPNAYVAPGQLGNLSGWDSLPPLRRAARHAARHAAGPATTIAAGAGHAAGGATSGAATTTAAATAGHTTAAGVSNAAGAGGGAAAGKGGILNMIAQLGLGTKLAAGAGLAALVAAGAAGAKMARRRTRIMNLVKTITMLKDGGLKGTSEVAAAAQKVQQLAAPAAEAAAPPPAQGAQQQPQQQQQPPPAAAGQTTQVGNANGNSPQQQQEPTLRSATTDQLKATALERLSSQDLKDLAAKKEKAEEPVSDSLTGDRVRGRVGTYEQINHLFRTGKITKHKRNQLLERLVTAELFMLLGEDRV